MTDVKKESNIDSREPLIKEVYRFLATFIGMGYGLMCFR